MDILERELRYLNWRRITTMLIESFNSESDNRNSQLLQNIANRLQHVNANSQLTFEDAMLNFVNHHHHHHLHHHTLMDLVRQILLLKRDGYQNLVDYALDNIGGIIEDWMGYIHH